MVWMPEQVWLKVGVFEVEYVALYTMLSVWIAALLLCKQSLRAGSSGEDWLDWVPYGLAGGVIGARLGYFLFEIPTEFLAEPGGLLWQPGFSLHGAVLGLLAGLAVFARLRGILVWKMWDDMAFAGAVGFLLMSLGLLFDSRLAGVPVDGPMSLTYPLYDEGVAVPPARLAVQHIQVILAGGIVALVAVLGRSAWSRRAALGTLTCTVLALVFLVLLLLDPWKEEARHVARAAYRPRAVACDVVALAAALGCFIFRQRRTMKL